MRVFIDTSAWVALADVNDTQHTVAQQLWSRLLSANAELLTTNYVVVEAAAVLQRKLGMQAVNALLMSAASTIVGWIDETTHSLSVQQYLAENRRSLSLVDCTSFEFMRNEGIHIAFCFDAHFSEFGFDILSEAHFSSSP